MEELPLDTDKAHLCAEPRLDHPLTLQVGRLERVGEVGRRELYGVGRAQQPDRGR